MDQLSIGDNKTSITVVMRAYNAAKYISEAIESVINQTYKGLIKIRVCYDEGTTDNTYEILEHISKNIAKPNRHIEIIRHKPTTPSRAMIECGLTSIDTDYTAILDYDNKYPENYIEKVMKMAENNDHVQFLFTNTVIISESGEILGGSIMKMPKNPYDFKKLIIVNHIDANTQILKKDCAELILKKLKELGHKFFDHVWDDWLIALLALKYCKPLYIQDAYVLYRIHSSNISRRNNVINIIQNLDKDLRTIIAFAILEKNSLTSTERIMVIISALRKILGILYYTTKLILLPTFTT